MSYKFFLFILCIALINGSLITANPLAKIPLQRLTPPGMNILNQLADDDLPVVHFKYAINDSHTLNKTFLDMIISRIKERSGNYFIALDDSSENVICSHIDNFITIAEDITKIIMWIDRLDVNFLAKKLNRSPSNRDITHQFVKSLFGLYHMNIIIASELIQIYSHKIEVLGLNNAYSLKILGLCNDESKALWAQYSSDYEVFFDLLRTKIFAA